MPVQPAAVEVLTALVPVLARWGQWYVFKVLAARPKDQEDATALWRLHGKTLDANRIRDTLRLLEEALGQSDLVPVFDAIVVRSGSR